MMPLSPRSGRPSCSSGPHPFHWQPSQWELACETALELGLSSPSRAVGRRLRLMGIKRRYQLGQRGDIALQWEAFLARRGELQVQAWSCAFGVLFNHGDNCEFDYLCAYETDGVLPRGSGFEVLELPPQQYAIFPHCGPLADLGDSIDIILNQWVDRTGLVLAQWPMLECYTPAFEASGGRRGIEIWIGLQVEER